MIEKKKSMTEETVRTKGSRFRIWYKLLGILFIILSFRLFLMEKESKQGILYLLFMTGAGGMVSFWGVWRHKEETNKDYVRRLLWDISQDEDYRDVFAAGKRWFLVNDRRKYWNMILIALMMQNSVLLAVYGLFHGASFIEYGCLLLFNGTILAVLLWMERLRRKEFIEILIKELRPLTAAVAFLMEALAGGRIGAPYMISVYNAMTGLYRAGKYEVTLRLADTCHKETENTVFHICCRSIRYFCLQNLNRVDEAKREAAIQKKILKDRPELQKKEEILASMQLIEIWEMLESNQREQAWEYTKAYLKQYKSEYYQLPILLIQIMIEEDRGKTEHAESICKKMLSYSPENIEVRYAMSYGYKSNYQESSDLFHNTVLDIAYLILSVIGTFEFILLIIVCMRRV